LHLFASRKSSSSAIDSTAVLFTATLPCPFTHIKHRRQIIQCYCVHAVKSTKKWLPI
jgi:hypothetical protein